MLKYVHENMPTEFLVKCDEDVAIRIDALYEMLGAIPQKQAVIGNIYVGYPVHRNTSKKWAKWAEQDYQVCYLSTSYFLQQQPNLLLYSDLSSHGV